jgi:hypothetical protein
MRNLTGIRARLLPLFLIIGIGGVLLLRHAAAATLCSGLPPSNLRVLGIRAETIDEVRVPAAELRRTTLTAGGVFSHHTLMLSGSDLAAWFDIEHRIVPREDGLVCNAPILVRMAFGSSGRHVFLAQSAAADACVREAMLDHEAAHNRVMESVVGRFINERQNDFRQGVTALKAAPAPSPEVAQGRWEKGMQAMLLEAQRQLLSELREASAQFDEPATLRALENACGSKIRQLLNHDD